ncbi:MAG: T9SS type A sorting domain-containing protein [Ignavibacteria bacterium]
MKKIFLFAALVILLCSSITYSQSGELTITQTNDGSFIDVSIFLKRTSAETWSLGFASFVFNFNTFAMNSPVEVYEGVWDNDSNSEYGDQMIAIYGGGNAVSIEIGLNSTTSAGTQVSDIPTIVGTIRFNISDPTQYHDITWNNNFSAILNNNGADLTNQITFINPFNEPLPVELQSFTGIIKNNDIVLDWTTTLEINNSGFQIERTKEILPWINVGFINGNGNSGDLKVYKFTDKNLAAGTYNYRLKQIDFNGNFRYYNLQNNLVIGIPEKFELSQNYPNPFNPETILRFSIPKLSKVKLSVYDITGREIVKLVDKELVPGNYEYLWNASEFSSGIYLYKLETTGFTDTKRMTLLK